MKAVLISIQPKWCELIASGKKMVEVRKTKPKLETPFKCYIYCTKPKELFDLSYDVSFGKVIGEFVCDQIDEIGYSPEMHGKYISDIDDIHYVSCVDFIQDRTIISADTNTIKNIDKIHILLTMNGL